MKETNPARRAIRLSSLTVQGVMCPAHTDCNKQIRWTDTTKPHGFHDKDNWPLSSSSVATRLHLRVGSCFAGLPEVLHKQKHTALQSQRNEEVNLRHVGRVLDPKPFRAVPDPQAEPSSEGHPKTLSGWHSDH